MWLSSIRAFKNFGSHPDRFATIILSYAKYARYAKYADLAKYAKYADYAKYAVFCVEVMQLSKASSKVSSLFSQHSSNMMMQKWKQNALTLTPGMDDVLANTNTLLSITIKLEATKSVFAHDACCHRFFPAM